MSRKFDLLVMGGDGIGPEVVACALKVADVAASIAGLRLNITEDILHGRAWDMFGTFCRDETIARAKVADAVLVGAVGAPQYDGIQVPGGPEMQDGLMRLRKEMDTYVGLRPARYWPALADHVPYKSNLCDGADVMVLREMCGGAFFTQTRGIDIVDGQRRGFDLTEYTDVEIARFAHAGFELARRGRGRLLSVDKSNVVQSGVLWRTVVDEVAQDYPDVSLTHFFADNASYQLARHPADFDVILADNLFGDMLSDQAAAISGSLGMLPSACLCGLPNEGQPINGIYEPVHGSAPDIVGQGRANPIGTILSVAMMLHYSASAPDVAKRIELAVESALNEGHRTADLGGQMGSAAMTDAIIDNLRGQG